MNADWDRSWASNVFVKGQRPDDIVRDWILFRDLDEAVGFYSKQPFVSVYNHSLIRSESLK